MHRKVPLGLMLSLALLWRIDWRKLRFWVLNQCKCLYSSWSQNLKMIRIFDIFHFGVLGSSCIFATCSLCSSLFFRNLCTLSGTSTKNFLLRCSSSPACGTNSGIDSSTSLSWIDSDWTLTDSSSLLLGDFVKTLMKSQPPLQGSLLQLKTNLVLIDWFHHSSLSFRFPHRSDRFYYILLEIYNIFNIGYRTGRRSISWQRNPWVLFYDSVLFDANQ